MTSNFAPQHAPLDKRAVARLKQVGVAAVAFVALLIALDRLWAPHSSSFWHPPAIMWVWLVLLFAPAFVLGGIVFGCLLMDR